MRAVDPAAAAPAVEVVVVEAMDITVVPVAPFVVAPFLVTVFLRHRLRAHPGRQPGRENNPQGSLHRSRDP